MAIRTLPSRSGLSRVTLCELPAAARLLANGAAASRAWATAALPMWLLGAYVIQPHLLRTATTKADKVPPKVVVDGVVMIVPPGRRQLVPRRAVAFVAVVIIGWAAVTFTAIGTAYVFGGSRGVLAVNGVLTALQGVLGAILAFSVIAGSRAALRGYPGRLPRSKTPLDRAAVRVYAASSHETGDSPLLWTAREYIRQAYPGCQVQLEARDEKMQHTYERLGFTTVIPGHSKMVGTVPDARP